MKLWLLFGLAGVLAYGVPVRRQDETALETVLRRQVRKYFETRQFGRILKNIVKEFDVRDIFQERKAAWSQPKINLFCIACANLVDELLTIDNTTLIFDTAIQLCVDLGFAIQFICESIIHATQDDIIYIIKITPNATGKDVCGIVFMGDGCTSDDPDRVWEITLPDVPKPPVDGMPYPETDSVPTMKILHLSDTHYDPKYVPGTSAACVEEFLCCREESNPIDNMTKVAGYWGSYGACDIPYWTLEAMYAHIAETHPDIDIIIWTGDIISHAVWNTTKEENLAVINEMADLISNYFPTAVVFPSVGNHEADPVNLYPQPYITEPEFDISWLYDELRDIWQRWLPAEAAANVAYSAYYSVPVRPGLKIISINTMHGFTDNWWLIHDSSDIANELDLIAKELQRAEDLGEYVYLIGHVSPGSGGCFHSWCHQFNRIVARYESTISGLFYGHSHNDRYFIFFDPDDHSRPTEVAYIGQSQTTYTDLNPGYKIYTVEGVFSGSRYRVLDHENYILDLTIANEINEANFFKLYTAKEEYGLADMSPSSMLDLVMRMNETNSPLFDKYLRNLNKASTPSLNQECNDECKGGYLCDILIADNSDHSTCDILYP